MKKLFPIIAALFIVVGCYDDSELWDSFNDHESRISKLEKICSEMNTNIASLQTIVEAMQKNDYITSVAPITEGGVEVGYTITFTSGKAITIYHGKDGTDGQPGKDGADGKDGVDGADGQDCRTPVIGVRPDADGRYYWTLDGEWLLDDDGNKVPAAGTDGAPGQDGTDGITPQLKIEEGYWYVSYDDGATWQHLYKAVGEDGADGMDGDSFFRSVEQNDTSVTFTLSDGTCLTLSKRLLLDITFESSDLVVIPVNTTREVRYQITSVLPEVKVEALSSSDIKVKVVQDSDDNKSGRIVIMTGPIIDDYSKVVVLVSDGETVLMRTLIFEEERIEVLDGSEIKVSSEGEAVELLYLSNVECEIVIPEAAQSWISVVPDSKTLEQHSVSLRIETNEGGPREAVVLLQNSDKSLTLEYRIIQEPNAAYQLELERDALIAIYKALDGDNWTNNENWCSDKPVGEWYGVRTDHPQGYVTNIFFMAPNNIKGSLPSSISVFNNLESLYLCDDGLSGIVQEEAFSSEHLREFVIMSQNVDVIIPQTINHLAYLEMLTLNCKSVTFPKSLSVLHNLRTLNISGKIGEIPEDIGLCSSLEGLSVTNTDITTLPNSIAQLGRLTSLILCNNNITGEFPSALLSLRELRYFDISNNNLTGQLPPGIALMLDNIQQMGGVTPAFNPSGNKFVGTIPKEIYEHPNWKYIWYDFYRGNRLDFTGVPIPAPDIEGYDIYGNVIDFPSLQESRPYTLLYQYPVGWGVSEMLFPDISSMKYISEKYPEMFNIVLWGEEYSTIASTIDISEEAGLDDWTLCTTSQSEEYRISINNATTYPYNIFPYLCIVDSNGYVIFSSKDFSTYDQMYALFDELSGDVETGYYESTDYSSDGKVTVLHAASKGNGVDVVLMGDAYSDRLIADGTYAADMKSMMDAFFSEEPYKSHKDYFNVYSVDVVSENEVYDAYSSTALDCWLGSGTAVGGNDAKCFNYGLKAISAEQMDNALIVVAMNSEAYAGTCYMYYPSGGDHAGGVSVAYFPVGADSDQLAQLVHHEAGGHGFAKLADEYAYEEYGEITQDIIVEQYKSLEPYGWWKNVDFTDDKSLVKWSHFLSDDRYQYDGLGVIEGACTYWTGAYRPSENSIMRYNTGGFNAPSREAIYYRIHKLAYGDDWEYDYESFVEYDEINRVSSASPTAARKQRTNYVGMPYEPTSPPVVVNRSWRDAE